MNIGINDIVLIEGIGHIYPSYADMARKLGATRWTNTNYLNVEDNVDTSGEFRVLNFAIEREEGFKDIIYLIEKVDEPHDQHLISIAGLKFVRHYAFIEDKEMMI